jgi:hypothetical protein
MVKNRQAEDHWQRSRRCAINYALGFPVACVRKSFNTPRLSGTLSSLMVCSNRAQPRGPLWSQDQHNSEHSQPDMCSLFMHSPDCICAGITRVSSGGRACYAGCPGNYASIEQYRAVHILLHQCLPRTEQIKQRHPVRRTIIKFGGMVPS